LNHQKRKIALSSGEQRIVLHSWKDIALFFGRSVRTVQRWELTLGMPVHRPAGRERAAVLAFVKELDAWYQMHFPQDPSAAPPHSDSSDSQHSEARRLIGWDEIARYIGRSVRTVQRWEREAELPVRREQPHARGEVTADPVELSRWLLKTPVLKRDTVRHQPMVLVVDDNQGHAYAVARIMSKHGFVVMQAYTGQEALENARRKPDLIFLDVHLPDIDGFEICRRLKADPETAAIPVLFLSSTVSAEVGANRAIALGAAGFLSHPPDSKQLLEVSTNLVH